jgi:hypothetical protein
MNDSTPTCTAALPVGQIASLNEKSWILEHSPYGSTAEGASLELLW